MFLTVPKCPIQVAVFYGLILPLKFRLALLNDNCWAVEWVATPELPAIAYLKHSSPYCRMVI